MPLGISTTSKGRFLKPLNLLTHVQEEELAKHARWCRRYATMNATGLRKIAKKHDKYAHNSAGQQFLQVQPLVFSHCNNTHTWLESSLHLSAKVAPPLLVAVTHVVLCPTAVLR